MSTIDAELEKAERCCAVSSCEVKLVCDLRGGYRATVALELGGGRSVTQCAWGRDSVHAIVQAFTVCRLRGGTEEHALTARTG
ncbi:MAG: hypothetical protein JNK82_29495 [Myxococcaceae bacterium]|nr:hypothetical protein [Myxococcaceae bacterium]